MILLIGEAEDFCTARVQRELRRRGCDVVRTSTPLAAPHAMSWRIAGDDAVETTWSVNRTSAAITGVLLRPSVRPVDPIGWEAADLEYVQHETLAALLAWLWSLDCPVVNRPRADLFYRPYRSYPEWHHLFATCGLPAAPICITNAPADAEAFGARHGGRATYAPLSSARRYPVVEPPQWDGLAKVAAHVPVCLLPMPSASLYATVVGDTVMWDARTPAGVQRLESGLIRLARALELELIQVEIAADGDAHYCLMVDPFPLLERHDGATQAAIVERLADRLAGAPLAAHRADARVAWRRASDAEVSR